MPRTNSNLVTHASGNFFYHGNPSASRRRRLFSGAWERRLAGASNGHYK